MSNQSDNYDRRPYGGVGNDIQAATGKQDSCMAFPLPCMYLDVPFSLVGDTLMLPFDAHYAHSVKAHKESLKRNPPDPDPLAGWKSNAGVQPDRAIVEDYQDYIEQLPRSQKNALIVNDHMVQPFEDTTGNCAIQIKIVLGHNLWKHVLIYDKSNKRVKVMKYKNGYLSP